MATSRREIAEELFTNGYNCAQSVLIAFKDLTQLDESTLSRFSCSFGGGMGRLREVCGCVSGMFMVLGLLYGYNGPETGEPKKEQYERVQELAAEFEKEHGSIICRELLGLSTQKDNPTPSARTQSYYQKRPCKTLVGDAAELLEKYIAEHPVPPQN